MLLYYLLSGAGIGIIGFAIVARYIEKQINHKMSDFITMYAFWLLSMACLLYMLFFI